MRPGPLMKPLAFFLPVFGLIVSCSKGANPGGNPSLAADLVDVPAAQEGQTPSGSGGTSPSGGQPGGFVNPLLPGAASGPLALSLISPSEGSSQGGTYLVLVGANVTTDTSVLIGGAPCPVISLSQSSIVCLTPPGLPGEKSVVAVRASDGSASTYAKPFVYLAPQALTTVSPTTVGTTGGQVLSLTGAGLRNGSSVSIGGVSCPELTYLNDQSVSCRAPDLSAGKKDIVVLGPSGETSMLKEALTVIPAPAINSVSPASLPAAAGGNVTIQGSHFGTAPSVTIGDQACSLVSASGSTIVCSAPPGTMRGVNLDVTVSSAPGVSAIKRQAILYLESPRIELVLPPAGSSAGGTLVSIYGSGFLNGALVKIGNVNCVDAQVESSSEIVCSTPAGSGVKDVIVQNEDGQLSSLVGGFRFNTPPVISNVTPSSGPSAGGQVVLIAGSGFQTGAQVTFGGLACADLTIESNSLIRCRPAPAQAGAKSITVTNPDAQLATLPAGYTHIAPPVLGSVSPAIASTLGGTEITLMGSSFTTGASVAIGGTSCANVQVVNSTTLTCEAPSGSAGVRNIFVTNPDLQVASLAGALTYRQPPVITSVSPSELPSTGGGRLTINGSGFDEVDPVVISVNGGSCTNIVVQSSALAECDVPAGNGVAEVILENPDGLYGDLPSAFLFYAPIALSNISPANGTNAGGDVITLSGSGFYSGTGVLVDGVPCLDISIVNQGTMTCITPPHEPGVVQIEVTSIYAGTASINYTFDPVGGELLSQINGSNANAKFGFVLGNVGNITGTAEADLLASAPGLNLAGTGRGGVALHDGLTRVKARETGITQVNNRFGQVLASGTDITGDGKFDLLVGEPYASCGGVERGRVTAYASSSNGSVWTKLFSACGDADNARFGWSLSFTGDSDLDTVSDFIVGAPNHLGTGAAGANQGRVYIYSGRNGRLIQLLRTGASNDLCGIAVASGFDTTGDSVQDAAIACGGTSTAYTHSIRSPFSGASIGIGTSPTSIGMMKDVNASGRAEIVVGKPTETNGWGGTGVLSVYDGASGAALCSVQGNSHLGFVTNANMSRDVFVIGDIMADNDPHILMGAWTHEYGNNKGYFRVVKASASGQCVVAATGSNRVATGAQGGGQLGRALGGGLDVNGDGRPDYIIGEPYIDQSASLTSRGRVLIYSGVDGALLHNVAGSETGAGFGLSVAMIGDQDGDGKSEFAAGAPSRTVNGIAGRGQVTIFKGGETGGGQTSPTVMATLSGDSDHTGFGYSIAAGLDLTGDGIPDFISGEPNTRGLSRGKVSLYSGSTGNLIAQVSGVANLGQFGAAVSLLSDIRNGSNSVGTDSRSEFAVAAPFEGANQEGVVHLFNGATQALITSLTDSQNQGEFGFALQRLRHDSDATLDLAIGQPGRLNSTGAVHVFNGSSLNRSCLLQGEAEQSRFGAAIANLSDLNGDGLDDYAVGAPHFDGVGTKRGKVYVYAGSSAGCGSLLFSALGSEDNALFGSALAPADVNNDGKMDLIIGSPKAAGGGVERGAITILSGNPVSYGTLLLMNNGYIDQSKFGSSVISLGHTDGSAAHDFIVGAPEAEVGSLMQAGAVYFFKSVLP